MRELTTRGIQTMLDQFISIAAHELRTPVTGVKLSAQLALQVLVDASLDKEQAVRHLHGIVSGANRPVLLMK